jgi:TetR/AcrR family transcriptional regulator, cholesterol catabolism regulator
MNSTEEKILLSAEELIFKYGIKNITMDEIAKHLSMSKKTIYKYFKEKDEIIHSLMKHHLEQDRCRVKNVYERKLNVVEEVFELMKEMREIFTKINPIVFHELNKSYPKIWKEFQDFKYNFIEKMVEDSLIRGQKEGLIRNDIHTKLLSRLRVEIIEMSLNNEAFANEKMSLAEVQIAVTEHFLYGVCTLKGHKLINRYKNVIEED